MASQRTRIATGTDGVEGPKKSAPSPPASGATTPVVEDRAFTAQVMKPDKDAYDAEQQALKDKIAKLQADMNNIQLQLNAGTPKNDESDGKREVLIAEQRKIREQLDGTKESREPSVSRLKNLNESIAKRTEDIATSRSKLKGPYKSVADIDVQLQKLERQVESGSMKLADEKRTLGDITSLKRVRKVLEKIAADQQAIEQDHGKVEELHRQLEDPKTRALSSRMDGIKAELDAIKKVDNVKYESRKVLVEQLRMIKGRLDDLFQQKRELGLQYREAHDRYWAKVQESRARRAERARAQKLAEEESKKMEIVNQLREDAAVPAYQLQVEDCQTLIDYFSGKTSGTSKLSTSNEPVVARNELAGVPKLELRQVEVDDYLKGLVPRKKKGEEEEAYFIGGGGGKKSKKSGSSSKGVNAPASAPVVSSSASSSGTSLNVPLPTLAALLSLSIPPLSSHADVPRVIEDLRIKKAWFEANQKRATEENIALAEGKIRELLQGGADSASAGVPVLAEEEGDAIAPNMARKNQQWLTPTPVTGSEVAELVAAGEVDGELEEEAKEAEN